MNQTGDDDVVDMHDPETDVKDLMRTLRARMEARRQQAERQGLDYDHLVDEPDPADSIGEEVIEMAGQIQQLRQSADGLRLAPLVTDWHVPFVNPLVNRFKNMLHALVLMYVNMLAGRQIAVNRTVARALLLVVSARQADAARLEALEKEVALLRKRLEPAD